MCMWQLLEGTALDKSVAATRLVHWSVDLCIRPLVGRIFPLLTGLLSEFFPAAILELWLLDISRHKISHQASHCFVGRQLVRLSSTQQNILTGPTTIGERRLAAGKIHEGA